MQTTPAPTINTRAIDANQNVLYQRVKTMWPSREWAEFWSNFGNVVLIASLVAGVIATGLIVWMSNVKEAYLRSDVALANEGAAKANERTAALERESSALKAQAEADRLARLKLESRIAPRSMTQEQQHELTAKLSQFRDVRGTIVALPSTPESELFVRALTAPLKAAGWEINIMAGQRDAMVLHPRGVIVQYPMELPGSADVQNGQLIPPPGPWGPLVDALNELGIAASAVPWTVQAPNNIAIVVSEK